MIGDILQPTHLLFILVVALIVLGPKRLPEVGRSLGKGLRDFRSALSGHEETEQVREALREARADLQETHQTLHEPIVVEPSTQQPAVEPGGETAATSEEVPREPQPLAQQPAPSSQ